MDLQDYAKRVYKTRSFLNEWTPFIILTLIAKLGAMSFSVFAGYLFFNDIFTRLFNSALLATLFSIINLVLIEAFTAILISKFFKFLFKHEVKTAIFSLIMAIGLFALSFISSTNGLAMRQGAKVNIETDLQTEYRTGLDSLKSEYIKARSYIETRINTIASNPQGWIGKKQSRLLSSQLDQIDEYYADIKELATAYAEAKKSLTDEFKSKKDMNALTVTNEANKYYNIVVLVMILIFIINGLLMYFFAKIYEESHPEGKRLNEIDILLKDVETKAEQRVLSAIDSYFNKPQLIIQQGDTCKFCGKPFERRGTHQKFCDNTCRDNFWNKK